MTTLPRERLLARGLRLEYVTVGWNVLEGIVAVGAGLAAGSIALRAVAQSAGDPLGMLPSSQAEKTEP
jgi:hypothetical protein